MSVTMFFFFLLSSIVFDSHKLRPLVSRTSFSKRTNKVQMELYRNVSSAAALRRRTSSLPSETHTHRWSVDRHQGDGKDVATVTRHMFCPDETTRCLLRARSLHAGEHGCINVHENFH